MRAGRLRHRLEFQEPVEDERQSGFKAKAWTTFATVWGAVEPLSAREIFSAQQAKSEVSHKITIRAKGMTGTKATMRVLFGERIFNLETPALNKDERGIEATLLAKEVAA